MKHIIKLTIFILLTGTIVFLACKKEKPAITIINPPPPPPPTPTGKAVKVKVLEYDADQPVMGTTVTVCTSPQTPGNCGGSYTSVITNSNGEAFFNADRFALKGIKKEGYIINMNPCFFTYFGNDFALYSATGICTADSCIIRIIPETDFIIHIRDSSLRGLPLGNYLTLDANFNNCSINGVSYVWLWQGIDTTIQYHNYYGNGTYNFTVGYDPDDGGFPTNILYQQQIYIAKGRDTIINITY